MRWLMVGTIPNDDFPFYHGPCRLESDRLRLGELSVPVHRGTPALLAAACAASHVLGTEAPQALLAGDIGRGQGSVRIYEHLARAFDFSAIDLLVFHYLQPDVDWHNRVTIAMEDVDSRPIQIADAGFMYVAKMSGFAASYDLFTPDAGEMAFLADETAPHPFYTRGFILQEEERIPELIQRAYQYENAARHLLVKGSCDVIACREGILDRICEPSVEAMEPIGGTGDTLTGLVAAMVAAGHPMPRACSLAAGANRWMGALANPTPAFAVAALLPFLPQALTRVME
jgi:NAD(P)H-hydrate repair Nnr-like enzyme with NAD(P)H-hydrate dehydratase domain